MDNEQLRKPVPVSMDRTPLFELRGICKNFSGVQALMDGNLVLHQREIHALVGGNGAGKSTLVNILSGNYPPEAGEILHHGKPISIDFPKVARHLGIATIYQNLSLVGTLDVTANLFLGQEIMTPPPLGWFGFLSKKKMQREAIDEFARLGINIPNVKSKVDRMSGGQRQAIACARVLNGAVPKLLIMDEPTAALGVRETEEILDLMYKCRNEGAAVLLISHNMEQVFRVADTITVLRLGQTVAQVRRDEVTSTQIVGLITGAIEKL
jgi:simple sugar transport system ATP-binding protein